MRSLKSTTLTVRYVSKYLNMTVALRPQKPYGLLGTGYAMYGESLLYALGSSLFGMKCVMYSRGCGALRYSSVDRDCVKSATLLAWSVWD